MFQLLIVDDEVNAVERMATMIPWHSVGIDNVYKAYSGDEALELLKTHPVDIVISDICMPGISGLGLIGEIGKTWKRTKCIVLSAYADFGYAQEAMFLDTCEYLVKPVTDGVLLESVKRVITRLKEEWDAIVSIRQTEKMMQESIPFLRNHLLHEILQGRKMSPALLQNKLDGLRIPLRDGMPFAIVLIRLEEKFLKYSFNDLLLMEYAVGNVAVEILDEYYHLWHCKDHHGYLVFLAQVRPESLVKESGSGGGSTWLLERLAAQIQDAVKNYLSGKISVMISKPGEFPDEISNLYHRLLYVFHKNIGQQNELILTMNDDLHGSGMDTLHSLYAPPSLSHLMEAEQWEAAEDKLNDIFAELNQKWGKSEEHTAEVFFFIYSVFFQTAHKKGYSLTELIGHHYRVWAGEGFFHSAEPVREWVNYVLQRFMERTETEAKGNRAKLVQKVQAFVQLHLDTVSLQSIADHVFLHPTYVSKIYKLETGETINEYVYRLRMDRSVYLLKHTGMKIFEIAEELGYNRPHYFISVFKKRYGCTPQEYREIAK